MVAPGDGHVINLQVRPGMVAGDLRFGAIATFICDEGALPAGQLLPGEPEVRRAGQAVEARSTSTQPDLHRQGARHLAGQRQRADAAERRAAQLPGGAQRHAARPVRGRDRARRSGPGQFPLGTQGRATIYARPNSPFVVLRKIGIRAYSWFNWVYPFSG